MFPKCQPVQLDLSLVVKYDHQSLHDDAMAVLALAPVIATSRMFLA